MEKSLQTKFTLGSTSRTFAPQTSKILKHLTQVGDISGVEAQALYRARSVTKRISEINSFLLEAGGQEHAVQGQWSRDLTGQRYKRYVMTPETRMALGVSYVNAG